MSKKQDIIFQKTIVAKTFYCRIKLYNFWSPWRGRRGPVDIASASGTEDPGSNPARVSGFSEVNKKNRKNIL
jgi:hypothetical protein